MREDHYDVIVIGSGPGGGSLTSRLAKTGKRILLLERGDYLPRSQDNWSSKTVFVDGAYQAKETWYGGDGRTFSPALHYYVGGNSKVYGAALFRMRERDFGEVRHVDGLSPAWPVSYAEFEPYYAQAEALFAVHGQRGEDPNEPWSSAPYDHPPVSHEPRIQKLSDDWGKLGLNPFHLPLGIKLDERDGKPTPTSICIRCDAFDGFPCLLNGKADAQVMTVDPTLARHDNVTLLVNAYVSTLETDPSGRTVSAVNVTREGRAERYSADVVVVACGALSSALLLLRSANSAHPNGLANGSDQVGRNYMRHTMSVLMALSKEVNDTVFQKTLAVSDFYFESKDWEFPMGLIQMCAKTHPEQIRGEEFPKWTGFLPDAPFDMVARHSMDFWLQSEDLPHPDNRVMLGHDGRVVLDVRETNRKAHDRLRGKLEDLLRPGGLYTYLFERSLYLGKDIPLSGTAHQAGTLRFGTDPKASVLDLNCKAHELDNLYVTDASFFPSIGAVNPTLTIIANALRVADHIAERLG
ncbi:6'''-hydroxyparomomycin C oxidase [Methylobacterium cerastii]|uniref:6'''-hydroxyparomomycin C oxidase n=1 Tax=Methylobacterium cerastii TaxID=932741 RepID=A0ABQ4QJ88_9HYPH|nr:MULTISPECIES: GMC family oxidoreductase [Methylobacterium]TXM68983.1 GMC family oxidoreductase [Methylobacterium sp. WL120]TXN07697.1 GMC family oxidoreductase [Methylobacterium sp. WL122]TXN81379.1 GMC family oxidoreductase [Methylobacterium sp. WL8]GJD45313.1 6'''-hydroxyparomomycin C oxidase [Methylobacterium cerastii]